MKMWLGFRAVVREVIASDRERKDDLQRGNRKLQSSAPSSLATSQAYRGQDRFLHFFRQHSEEA